MRKSIQMIIYKRTMISPSRGFKTPREGFWKQLHFVIRALRFRLKFAVLR